MSTAAVQYEVEQAPLAPPAPRWTRWRAVFPALVLAWITSGVYLVAPDQQAVETLFGRVVAQRVTPGLHYALPWPISSVVKVKVWQQRRLVIGGDLPDGILGRTPPLALEFLTGDQNIINLRVVAQYSVGTPADYVFRLEEPDRVVGAVVEAELARRVARRGVDAVLTSEKAAVQDEVRAAAQRVLDGYRAGVLLSSINIESAAPPRDAADAFRDVASARADSSRIVSDAEGYANDVIPKARGLAQQMLEQAAGYREKKVNEANGDAARFNQIATQYQNAAPVTGRRLYLETMEAVLPKIKKLIVDKDGNLDLTIVRRGDSQAGK